MMPRIVTTQEARALHGAMEAKREFLDRYRQTHQHPVNRALHAVGIPMIVVSLPLAIFHWRAGLALFVVGWILQFVGHAFEGKAPAFFSDPRFLLVGPYWWLMKFFGGNKKPARVARPSPGPAEDNRR